MLSLENKIPQNRSKSNQTPKARRPAFFLKGHLDREQNFLNSSAIQTKPSSSPTSLFSAHLIDQTFIWSLVWIKICILALVTNAHLVRFLDFTQMQAPLIMVCIYGISWINYQLTFKIMSRATFGQALK